MFHVYLLIRKDTDNTCTIQSSSLLRIRNVHVPQASVGGGYCKVAFSMGLTWVDFLAYHTSLYPARGVNLCRKFVRILRENSKIRFSETTGAGCGVNDSLTRQQQTSRIDPFFGIENKRRRTEYFRVCFRLWRTTTLFVLLFATFITALLEKATMNTVVELFESEVQASLNEPWMITQNNMWIFYC